jgi:hypothetical protein
VHSWNYQPAVNTPKSVADAALLRLVSSSTSGVLLVCFVGDVVDKRQVRQERHYKTAQRALHTHFRLYQLARLRPSSRLTAPVALLCQFN